MVDFVNAVDAFIDDYFNVNIPDVSITDVIEVFIIAYFMYHLLVWVKNSRVWMLIRGVLIIMLFFLIAAIFQMNTILWLGEKLVSVAVTVLIVVFQPELRRALEQIGRRKITSLFTWNILKTGAKKFDDSTIVGLVTACYEMGAVKTGALIVVEKDMQLTEFERTGIGIDAVVSRQLLINIFEKNTPLHDGAVIVRGDRVVSATCYLPLSDNMALSKDLGTRHRAAVGISEVSDSLTIVVSEETGTVSYAREGRIVRDVKEDELIAELKRLQSPEEAVEAFTQTEKEGK
ncbi:diadenylate cyclase [Pseudobutyrivibrio sp. 49]|uniref:diadenylate cyclase CdaA n=1 Tax=unclassified Pseudobutyrivibrio TaxID=2638619 RepID=UPI00089270FA|nr:MULTISPECIES: diadenylate cyclase CdaA [unclassified Pseudobutyrivibrio]SDI81239.1 diadenylate cyclase [Pseudobutyrivibrio sp. 49]SFN76953.1 diadenylate cyclase [Pseudobutyrivibrio sp. UC1225]